MAPGASHPAAARDSANEHSGDDMHRPIEITLAALTFASLVRVPARPNRSSEPRRSVGA